jgi:hypothetical protein
LKKYLALIALFVFVLLVAVGGCGGGGGGSSSNGSTDASTDGSTDATTDGTTDGGTSAGANSTILGRIVREGSTLGVPNIRVVFYDINGVQVGQAITRTNGYFDANLGTNAKKFHLDPTTIPSSSSSGFLRMYKYNLKWYSAIEPSCKASLPTIVPGVLTEIPNDPIQLRLFNGTPPFPDGCSQ